MKGYVIPLQNTTQQPDLVALSQSRDAPGDLREFLEPRRARRRQRHARHHRASGAASRAEGQAARLSELCGLEARRPDGQERPKPR